MLTWFFNAKGGYSPATIPVPTAQWPLVVDPNGHPIENRAPTPADKLARRGMEYRFSGTSPAFTPDARQTPAQNKTRRIAFALEDQRNFDNLARAVFILSQTDDGRRLLARARELDFSFEFDRTGTEARGAAGLCDYANKKIPLHPESTPELMALTLKHELQHMDDIAQGVGYGLDAPLHDQIKASRLLEASARASEAVLAYQATHIGPNAPANAWLPASIASAFQSKLPAMAAAAQNALPFAEKGAWGNFFAAVMPAFIQEEKTITFYERDTFESILRILPHKPLSQLAHDPVYGPHTPYYREKMRTLCKGAPLDFTSLYEKISCCGQKIKAGADATKLEKTFYGLSTAAADSLQKLKDHAQAVWVKTIPLPDFALPSLQPIAKPGAFQKIRDALSRKKAAPPQETKKQIPAIAAYVPPARIDGSTLTNGMKSHEHTTRFYERCLKKLKMGNNTSLDAINLAVDAYVQEAGISYKASVSDLVEAGFRGPIAAMPCEYINDLRERIYYASRTRSQAGKKDNAFTSTDKILMDHWKALAVNGIDPVTGDLAGWIVRCDTTRMSYYTEIGAYFESVKPATPKPAQQANSI